MKYTTFLALAALSVASAAQGSSLREHIQADLAETEMRRKKHSGKSPVYLAKSKHVKRSITNAIKEAVSDADPASLLKEVEGLADDVCKTNSSISWTMDKFLDNLNQDAQSIFGDQLEVRTKLWNCNAVRIEAKKAAMSLKSAAKIMLNAKSFMSPSELVKYGHKKGISTENLPVGKVGATSGYVGPTEPTEVNWVKKGFQTPIKDQGNCNDCYAVSGHDMISSRCFIKTDQLFDLSAQQFLDCKAGTCDPASVSFIEGMYGWVNERVITNYADMPLTSAENLHPTGPLDNPAASCPNEIVKSCEGTGDLEFHQKVSNSELMGMVTEGPVQVLVNFPNVPDYKCGLYTEADAPQPNGRSIDHAVLIVGFNYTGDPSTSGWIVKNSYGTVYGFEGYFAVAMDGEGAEDPASYNGYFNGVMSINSNIFLINNGKFTSGAESQTVKNPENPFADGDIFNC